MDLLRIDVAGENVLQGLVSQLLEEGGLVGFHCEHVVRADSALAQGSDLFGESRDVVGFGLHRCVGHHGPRPVVQGGDQLTGPVGGRAGAP